MDTAIFHTHSGLRYLVLLAGVVALVVIGRALAARLPYGKGARVSGAAFTGLLDLQVVVGIVTALVRPWKPAYVGHVVTMVLAVAAAHVLRVRARNAADDRARHVSALLAVLVPLVLIVAGILAIGRRIV